LATRSCAASSACSSSRCRIRRAGAFVDALEHAGASAADVVRTRLFITDPAFADDVGRVHGEVFGATQPAATMVVVAGLVDERWAVEIEAEAVIVDA
jgi:enamine deaminase RidA (YjgF/YER057c/UK114 family)